VSKKSVSFFDKLNALLFPIIGIMLTKNVWSIHSKIIPFSNNSLKESVTFSLPLLKISSG